MTEIRQRHYHFDLLNKALSGRYVLEFCKRYSIVSKDQVQLSTSNVFLFFVKNILGFKIFHNKGVHLKVERILNTISKLLIQKSHKDKTTLNNRLTSDKARFQFKLRLTLNPHQHRETQGCRSWRSGGSIEPLNLISYLQASPYPLTVHCVCG